nr:IgA Peptidase M64 [uncultured Holophaga sp.]
MLRPLALLIAGLTALGLSATQPRTMRVDYYHSGNAQQESFSLDRVVVEPQPWPGNLAKRLDTTNRGKFLFEVLDRSTNQVLYSRGFSSIFGEWQDTPEARGSNFTSSESLRFPMPEHPVQIVLKKRDEQNAFREIWSFNLDPKADTVDPSQPPSPGPLIALEKNGEPSEKVDFLIMGDGYTAAERGKFEKDARRMMELLFAKSPYKEHRKDFNVWGICPPAQESGISRPSTGVHRRSPLGCTYDAFGSERYVLSFENRTVRDMASYAPYEFMEILVNGKTYGGGGIFGLYGTVAADNAFGPYIFVHEFGHHFADLADEYYTSDVYYETGKPRIEPWMPNVTADPRNPKWKELLTPGIPLPTPWKKAEFEKDSHAYQKERREIRAANRPESEMEALMKREEARESVTLGQDTWSGKVGTFEGANYEPTGYYRSQTDCIMFTRDQVPFCAACQKAIEGIIQLYIK